ncbi:MAG: hypothetical protein ACMXYB_01515 [Candidatus Woesearchaeota archaeon]
MNKTIQLFLIFTGIIVGLILLAIFILNIFNITTIEIFIPSWILFIVAGIIILISLFKYIISKK